MTTHQPLTPQQLRHAHILVVGDVMLDRFIVGHVSRISPEAPVPVIDIARDSWTAGGAAKGKGKAGKKAPQSPADFVQAAANWELFDLSADYGETTNVAAQHPEVVAELIAKHDAWWKECRPLMVNENVAGPAENPFKVLYREQMGK